jgi:5-dehydro-2-deoxygluconokinase
MAEPAQYFDLITMGRIGVDLYPLQTGVPLAQVETFGKFLGGSAANVAVAAARLGRRTAVITRTGDDPFGTYLHEELRGFGVDDRWVTPVGAYPTPITFCEIFPPDDFPLYFYRRPKAPDLEIHTDELDFFAIRGARIFWITGTGLSEEPSRSATLAALKARDKSGLTVFDLDWRPMFWRDPEEARPYYREALRHATVAVGNLDECEIATGVREPQACAEALLEAGVELAVVKQGPKGVLAVHRDGTSAYTWLKLPVTDDPDDMAEVLETSTLPVVLLGGEVGEDQEGAYERWRKALRLPTVQGLVVGRSLLYPAEGSVEQAVDTAVSLL